MCVCVCVCAGVCTHTRVCVLWLETPTSNGINHKLSSPHKKKT